MRNCPAITVPLVTLALLAACGCSSGGGTRTITGNPRIVGNGSVVEELRTLGGCTGINLSGIGTVYVEQGPVEELRVRAEANLIPYLRTAVHGTVLVISKDLGANLAPTRPIEYFLTVPDLDTITLPGAGNIKASDLNLDQLWVSFAGVGGIELSNLDATELVVVTSGVGDVTASGRVDRQVVTVSGFGNYRALNLQSIDSEVLVSSWGSAWVQFSSSLVATVTGRGSVYYIGDPAKVVSTITGTGSVEPY